MPASAPGFDVFLIAVASIFALVQVVLVTSPLLLIFGWGSKQVKAVTGGNPAARAREVLFSTKFLMRLATCVATVTIVVKMAARVSSDAPFDPYEILAVPASANATELKAAYRALSLAHHPDKAGGSAEAFQRVTQAYASVSDGKGKRNFELYGHPDGPQSVTLGVALPEWMMSDNAAPFLLLAYLAFFAVGGWLCVRWWTVRVAAARKQLSGGPGGLSGQDVASMRQHLAAAVAQGGGRASLFDVVDAVCASPSMLQAGAKALACSPEDITTSPEEVAAALGKLRDVLLSLELSGQGRLPAAAGDGTSQSSLNKLVVLLHLNGKRLKEGALDPDDFPTCLTNGQVKLVRGVAVLLLASRPRLLLRLAHHCSLTPNPLRCTSRRSSRTGSCSTRCATASSRRRSRRSRPWRCCRPGCGATRRRHRSTRRRRGCDRSSCARPPSGWKRGCSWTTTRRTTST